MQVLEYSIERFCEEEADLCKMHKVDDDDTLIDVEIKRLHRDFARMYRHLNEGDYEFPAWHHNLRLFWVYLYSGEFYNAEFIPNMQSLLASTRRSWFAQFECYDPPLESPELPSGSVGHFLIYKDTVIFQEDDRWSDYRPKLLPSSTKA